MVVSGRAHGYLKSLESDRLGVNRIWGLSLVYEDNRVRNFRTVLANLKGALVEGGWPENIRTFFDIAERFRPDVVVSDFESWSYLFARMNGLPVISVDNQQIVARCELARRRDGGARGGGPAHPGHREGQAPRAASTTSSPPSSIHPW